MGKRVFKFLVFIMILGVFVIPVSQKNVQAANNTAMIDIEYHGAFTLTNDKGQYISGNGKDFNFKGTMPIIDENTSGTMNSVNVIFEIASSSSFTYKSNNKKSNIAILGNGTFTSVDATNAKSISFSYSNGIVSTSVTGENMSYTMGLVTKNSGEVGVDLTGKIANGTVKMSDTKQGLVITGEGGLNKIVRDDLKDRKSSIKTMYFIPYASPVIIKNINKKYSKIINAKKVYKTTYKNKINLKAYQQGKAVRLSWNPIKKAKSYVIYKYNPKTKKYYKKKTVMGQYTTLWIDRNLASNKGYRYQVRPYYGKGKYGKKSYYVSAITQSTTRGNVSKISPNKKSVKGRVGTKLRMKAKVRTSANKKTYSKNIRWFSNNHKVASITRQGKLVLKKKGKTYIWAKAHNGRNIRVNVVVR